MNMVFLSADRLTAGPTENEQRCRNITALGMVYPSRKAAKGRRSLRRSLRRYEWCSLSATTPS